MQLKLSKKWTDKLLEIPETGMGYHVATVKLNDGKEFSNVVISNSSHMSIPDMDIKEEDIREIIIRRVNNERS